MNRLQLSSIPHEQDPLLRPEEAARYLRVTRKTLDTWRSTGRYNLPFVKIGRRVAYRQSALEQFIHERTATSTS